MKKTEVILPKRIPILREQPNQDIKVKNEEFSLYFDNFIHPIYPWQDIVVECNYGKNLGHCWRIDDYPADVDEFELNVKIYDEDGNLETEKKTIIELYDQDIDKQFKILCIGDSMTQHTIYVSQLQNRLKNVFTCGTRSYDGHVYGEGRGGWTYKNYLNNHSLKEGERGPISWISPFLFPKGISGTEYFGDMEFYKASQEKGRSTCCFNGFEFDDIRDGQYYHKYGKIYKYGDDNFISDNVEWEFSFKKYMIKNGITELDAVSLLMGANDLAPYVYDNENESMKCYIENIRLFINSIKEADKNIDIIINLPVSGSEQAAFGNTYGCGGTYKAQKRKMREAAKEILLQFEDIDNVYICPMAHAFDSQNGFDRTSIRANLYCDKQIEIKDDAIHPNSAGYRQMGDALAGTVEMIRHKSRK